MQIVARSLMEEVAALKPVTPPAPSKPSRNGYEDFDLERWIEERNVPVKCEKDWQSNRLWLLEECPWNGHADSAAYIIRFSNGGISAACHHDSCQGKGWRDLREHYEPGAYERNRPQARPHDAVLGVDEWEPPAPLPDGLPPVDTFDPVMLPECLKSWLEDIADRMQVPLDYLAAGAMVVGLIRLGGHLKA